MQALFLAAGKGTRLRPLTYEMPKPIIDVCGTPLLERGFKALPDGITEIIVVINYLRKQITEHFGDKWNGIPIKYVVQEPLTGTAGALLLARHLLKDRFLVLNGDDLYTKTDLERLIAHELGILVHETDSARIKASAIIDENNRFVGIEYNAPEHETKNQVCGAYILDERFFDYDPVEIQVGRYREFGLPQTLVVMSRDCDIFVEKAAHWMPVGTPEELDAARERCRTSGLDKTSSGS